MESNILIQKRLQAFHPGCLIRDVKVEDTNENGFRVSYLKIRKDDSWTRCTLDIKTEKIEKRSETDVWDKDETDKIAY